MTEQIHLIIEEGNDKGKQILVPPEGMRAGRSSKNDLALTDPLLSRHHCRLFFKNGTLSIIDLGSANETLVNNNAIKEEQLRVGDLITIGDTVLKVLNNNESLSEGAVVANKPHAVDGSVDLGLSSQTAEPVKTKPSGESFKIMPIIIIAGIAILLVTAVAFWKWKEKANAESPNKPIATNIIEAEPLETLKLDYEKVTADTKNIFRYKLLITENRTISIQTDDLNTGKQIVKKGKIEDDEVLRDLIRSIKNSSFFSLDDSYVGIAANILDTWDISITIGKDTHRVMVSNRVEPELFKSLRKDIEAFAADELHVPAQQYSPEKLIGMAKESRLLGKKYHDESSIDPSNLGHAIKNFAVAEWYLETIEPKPDFYDEILKEMSICKEELNKKYEGHIFRAERAMKLKEWNEAAQELRTILDMILDRADPRYQKARKKLLNVEAHMTSNR
ncbi:FHA domain-containing protein [Verrucomicrobiota bacterium]